MTLSLTAEKIQKVAKAFQVLFTSHSATLLERSCKDSIKIPSASTDSVSKEKINFQSAIILNTKPRTKLTWCIENVRFCNRRTFPQLNLQMIVQTDASLTG